MKKSSKSPVTISVILLVLLGSLFVYINTPTSIIDSYDVVYYSTQKEVSGIEVSFEAFSGHRTILVFESDAENRITVNYSSDVQGDFSIIVIDPSYKVIEKISPNNNGSKFIQVKNPGKYKIRLVGNKSEGAVNINLAADREIKVGYNN